jgi:hypothetical protein
MKKNKKIIITLIMIAFFLIYLSLNFISYGDFDTNDYKPKDQTGGAQLQNIATLIISGVQMVGSAVSIIAIVIIGIKYMLGSVEERSEYKKSMGPYLIGALMVFGISNVIGLIQDIVTNGFGW